MTIRVRALTFETNPKVALTSKMKIVSDYLIHTIICNKSPCPFYFLFYFYTMDDVKDIYLIG